MHGTWIPHNSDWKTSHNSFSETSVESTQYFYATLRRLSRILWNPQKLWTLACIFLRKRKWSYLWWNLAESLLLFSLKEFGVVFHLCGLSEIFWLVWNSCCFFKMHLKEFWRLKYLIFPCHPSCTVVSSNFSLLGGNVQFIAESVPKGQESS